MLFSLVGNILLALISLFFYLRTIISRSTGLIFTIFHQMISIWMNVNDTDLFVRFFKGCCHGNRFYDKICRVRPIRVKWPMFDVPIFRRKNSDSDGRCRCLVGTVTSVDVDKLRAQAYASMPTSYIANYIYCTIADF